MVGLADLVLAISEQTRRDLLALAGRAGLPAPPVAVVRLGDELAGPAVRPAGLPEWVGCGFVLSVGTLEARKNHELLYQLWRRLAARHGPALPPLVWAGRPGWLTADLLQRVRRDPLTRERVLLLPGVTDPHLRWLYGGCRFTLYPSHYEGWGLPVAEALAQGKWCVCSDASSLPEIAPGLVGLHDPLDLDGCRRLAERALFEDGFLEQQERRLRRLFRPTPWAACADQLLHALRTHLGLDLGTPGQGVRKAA
jgi:glycosyltransferase involved in cell wall biosynthesis